MKSRAENWIPAADSFLTTRWTVILEVAGRSNNAVDHSALDSLYRSYWPPIYGFIRRRGYRQAEAEDLTQDFFLYLLDQNACAKADPGKGKFRSFVLAWLKNYLSTIETRERRKKRGGGQIPVYLDASPGTMSYFETEQLKIEAPADEERLFEWFWASALVRQAMESLAAEYSDGAKHRVFAELKPFLTGGTGIPAQEEVAARLEMPIETLRSHLSRLRGRYRQILRTEVTRTIPESSDIDEELRYLIQVLITSMPRHTPSGE